MRVVHLTWSVASGGAAVAARRLHEALRSAGIASEAWVTHDPGSLGGARRLEARTSVRARVRRHILRALERGLRATYAPATPRDLELFSPGWGWDIAWPDHLQAADIVHVHWVAGIMSLAAIHEAVPATTPIVLTLHDLRPFTGGCHYPGACDRYLASCGACWQLGSNHLRDWSHSSHVAQQAAWASLRSRPVAVVAPSEWIRRQALSSPMVRGIRIARIPYAVDSEVYSPTLREASRERLQLVDDEVVIACAAADLRNPRKGADVVQQAARLLNLSGLHPTFVLVGRGADQALAGYCGRVLRVGEVQGDQAMAALLAAADLAVVPSREDNLPNTVLEALAVGIPVVGTEAGGIPEYVLPGRTGLLALPGDAASLSQAIQRLVCDAGLRRAMGSRARALTIDRCAPGAVALEHIRLYKSLAAGEYVAG